MDGFRLVTLWYTRRKIHFLIFPAYYINREFFLNYPITVIKHLLKSAINFMPNDIIKKFLSDETDTVAEKLFITKLNEQTALRGKILGSPQKIQEVLRKIHIIIVSKRTSRISRQNRNSILPVFELKKFR